MNFDVPTIRPHSMPAAQGPGVAAPRAPLDGSAPIIARNDSVDVDFKPTAGTQSEVAAVSATATSAGSATPAASAVAPGPGQPPPASASGLGQPPSNAPVTLIADDQPSLTPRQRMDVQMALLQEAERDVPTHMQAFLGAVRAEVDDLSTKMEALGHKPDREAMYVNRLAQYLPTLGMERIPVAADQRGAALQGDIDSAQGKAAVGKLREHALEYLNASRDLQLESQADVPVGEMRYAVPDVEMRRAANAANIDKMLDGETTPQERALLQRDLGVLEPSLVKAAAERGVQVYVTQPGQTELPARFFKEDATPEILGERWGAYRAYEAKWEREHGVSVQGLRDELDQINRAPFSATGSARAVQLRDQLFQMQFGEGAPQRPPDRLVTVIDPDPPPVDFSSQGGFGTTWGSGFAPGDGLVEAPTTLPPSGVAGSSVASWPAGPPGGYPAPDVPAGPPAVGTGWTPDPGSTTPPYSPTYGGPAPEPVPSRPFPALPRGWAEENAPSKAPDDMPRPAYPAAAPETQSNMMGAVGIASFLKTMIPDAVNRPPVLKGQTMEDVARDHGATTAEQIREFCDQAARQNGSAEKPFDPRKPFEPGQTLSIPDINYYQGKCYSTATRLAINLSNQNMREPNNLGSFNYLTNLLLVRSDVLPDDNPVCGRHRVAIHEFGHVADGILKSDVQGEAKRGQDVQDNFLRAKDRELGMVWAVKQEVQAQHGEGAQVTIEQINEAGKPLVEMHPFISPYSSTKSVEHYAEAFEAYHNAMLAPTPNDPRSLMYGNFNLLRDRDPEAFLQIAADQEQWRGT